MRVNHKRVSFPLGYRQYSADSAWHPHQYQTNSCSSSGIPQIHPHLPSPAKTWWCAPDHAPKLTNILLSLDTPMTQNILCCSITCTPHMCGLWFALFRWHSLSCSTTCFPFPTPTHVDMCAHTHTHTPLKKKKKKDIPQIWPDDPIMKQCTVFQAWVWGGTFQGIWGRHCFFLSELYYGVAQVFCLRGPVGAMKETRHTTGAGNQSSVTWSRV